MTHRAKISFCIFSSKLQFIIRNVTGICSEQRDSICLEQGVCEMHADLGALCSGVAPCPPGANGQRHFHRLHTSRNSRRQYLEGTPQGQAERFWSVKDVLQEVITQITVPSPCLHQGMYLSVMLR